MKFENHLLKIFFHFKPRFCLTTNGDVDYEKHQLVSNLDFS